jgi:tRNA (cmo5U34)-methyltransferase
MPPATDAAAPANAAAAKFDPARAAEYAVQSRIALAGYEACHDLAACLLAASLGSDRARHILVAGIGGTAQEIVSLSKLTRIWRFTGLDPSGPMLDLARSYLAEHALEARVDLVQGTIADLPADAAFDGATLIGVLHHLPGDAAKHDILRALSSRLKPGAPLILAGNRYAYASQPLLLKAWGERWRMHGASGDEVQAKLGKILQGADPPASDAAVAALLDAAGFEAPQQFFSSLFWGAWIANRR